MTTQNELEEARSPVSIEPIDYQCVLLERVHRLADHHQKILKDNPYKSVRQLNTNGDPGTVMSRIKHGEQTEAVREILSLCPDVHALLVPYIRISRVDYDENGKPTGEEKDLKIPNFLSPDDVSNILSGDIGRAPGAGIKSFKWELAGVQPEDVDNNITATLKIYFQSIGDFFEGAKNSADRFQAGLDEPTFLDLIINSPSAKKVKAKKGTAPSTKKEKSACPDAGNSAFNSYDGKNFRIKVCAGWAVPPNLEEIYPELSKTRKGASKTRAEILADAIRATRVSLFLQQVRHDISFNQNGSLTLTINYQAALSGITRSRGADILIAGSNAEKIKELRDKKKKIESDDDPNNDDEVDDILEELDKLEKADRKEKYDQLLANVYKSDKIYEVSLTAEQLLVPSLAKLPYEERRKIARKRYINVHGDFNEPTNVLMQQHELEALGGKKGEKKRKKLKKRPADTVTVPYIYFGDLIDAILQNLPGGKPEFDFFTSEVEIIDMLVAMRVKEIKQLMACRDPAGSDFLKELKESTTNTNLNKLYKLINIGDIPISLDAFQSFFIKNVVDKQRNKYYFLQFVKDVCAKLISNAMRSGCYGGGIRFNNRFDAQPISMYKTDFSRTKATEVKALARAQGKLTCAIKDTSKFGLGLVLISTDAKGRGLTGNYDKDVKKGIYHHYIGSACGLVKKIDFQREDQAYLREANIQREGALGAEQLRELYSVNISLVGNNLYRNGSYVYVSPLLINTTKQQLSLLGLHGYYLVTSVSSEITENSFTTSIRALQEGVAFPDESSINTQKPTSDPAPNQNPQSKKEETAQSTDSTDNTTPPTSTPVANDTSGQQPEPGTAIQTRPLSAERREDLRNYKADLNRANSRNISLEESRQARRDERDAALKAQAENEGN